MYHSFLNIKNLYPTGIGYICTQGIVSSLKVTILYLLTTSSLKLNIYHPIINRY